MAKALKALDRLRGRYRWNKAAQRYTVNGRFVSGAEVRQAVAQVMERGRAQIRILGRQLAAGQISVAHFQREMMEKLKTLHIVSAAAARGGLGQLSATEYGRIGARLRDNYRRLDRFAGAVADGRMSPRQIIARADMYAGNARQAFENEKRISVTEAGYEQERRILGAAEHCPDCIRAAALGWQTIGTLPPIGATRCISNCRCRFIYRIKPEKED